LIGGELRDRGQKNSCGSSLSRIAGDGDGAADLLDCGFHDGEAEAGSAGGASAGGVGAVEALEDVREIGGMDAFAVVLNGDFDGIALKCGVDFDPRLRRAVLNGVEEEVAEDEGTVVGSERDVAGIGRKLVNDDADLTDGSGGFELGNGG